MRSNYTSRLFECFAAVPALLFALTPILSGVCNLVMKPENSREVIDSNYLAVTAVAPVILVFSLLVLIWVIGNRGDGSTVHSRDSLTSTSDKCENKPAADKSQSEIESTGQGFGRNVCERRKVWPRSGKIWNSTYLWFGLFVVWMVIATFVNGITPYVYKTAVAASGYYYKNENLFTHIAYFAIFFAVTSCISRERIKNAVLFVVSIVSLLLAGLMVWGFYANNWIGLPVSSAAEGNFTGFGEGILKWIWIYWGQQQSVFNNLNHYAYFLTVIILVGAAMFITQKSRGKRIFYLIVFVANSVVLCLNETMGSYIAVWVGLVFLIIVMKVREKKRGGTDDVVPGTEGAAVTGVSPKPVLLLEENKRVIRMALLMPLLFLGISLIMDLLGGVFHNNMSYLAHTVGNLMMQKREKQSTQLGAGRIWLWRLTIEYMKERPISWVFGFGIEGYGGRMLADTLAQNRCNNEFLQYMSFFGVPALVFYAGGCLSVFMRALRNKANLTPCQIAALAAALGYLASSFFGVSVINSAPFLFIMLGLAYRSPEQAAGK
jgi:hypothetical protein